MTTMSAAVMSGARRGARLAVKPTAANYRRLRTTSQKDVTTVAWSSVGRTIRQAMSQESPSQSTRSSK